jgi:hypothetical protein
MVRGVTVSQDGLPVIGGCVTLVVLPAVLGISKRKPGHESIPTDLRHDAGAGNGVHLGVPSHHRRLPIQPQLVHRESVEQEMLWLGMELRDCALHGQTGCPEDVDPVDLVCRRRPDANADRFADDDIDELFALQRSQFLRIISSVDKALGGKDDRSRDNRTGEGTATYFVDPGNAIKTKAPEPTLVLEQPVPEPFCRSSCCSSPAFRGVFFRCGCHRAQRAGRSLAFRSLTFRSFTTRSLTTRSFTTRSLMRAALPRRFRR